MCLVLKVEVFIYFFGEIEHSNTGCGTFDGDLLALKVVQVAQQHLLPVTPVADEAQVRQGALRRAHLLLHLRQQVTLGEGVGRSGGVGQRFSLVTF